MFEFLLAFQGIAGLCLQFGEPQFRGVVRAVAADGEGCDKADQDGIKDRCFHGDGEDH